jgi:hypothetical protein
VPSNQVFITVHPLSRLYTDDTGRFLVRACSGNQYVMITFHADGNLILQQAFKSKSDRHRIAAYNAIMIRLSARGLSVDLQILNNKASVAYKEAITFKWNEEFQLVPPDMHCQNRAERAICTFKDHFLAILAASTLHFPCTFGTFFCHRPNSPSISSIKPCSIQGFAHGNFFKVPLTSTRHHLIWLFVASSSTQSRLLGNLEISGQNQVSILDLPWTPIAASS